MTDEASAALLKALKGWLPIMERQFASLPPEAHDSNAYRFAKQRVEETRAAIALAEQSTG